ncbi:MAG: YcaO-like family protein [Oligoflexia bacterium]|nr:YcaO-like family protein [Oligoflexia bacterium]
MNEKFTIPLELWNIIDEFNEIVEISGKKIYCSGMAAKNINDLTVTGSSASLKDFPKDEAYYELLERVYTIEKIQQDKKFNEGDTSKSYKISLSNGVALHNSLEEASLRARCELIERDRVLRSWYGEYSPLEMFNDPSTQFLYSDYDVKTYNFINHFDPRKEYVVGAFAFPKRSDCPFCYGFGCHPNYEFALNKSSKELIQRIGFLFGEKADIECEFAPTALYHQEFYMGGKGREIIERWLLDKKPYEQIFTCATDDIKYKTISTINNLYLVKATSDERLPLIFGKGYQIQNREIRPEKYIHPIA